MRARLLAVCVAVAASGCIHLPLCQYRDPAPPQVVHYGTPAADADVVVQVAQEFAGKPVTGYVTWVEPDAPLTCGKYTMADGCKLGGCLYFNVLVRRYEPATRSALAHEIGHYVLDSYDEVAVEAWAQKVKAEAARRLAAQ